VLPEEATYPTDDLPNEFDLNMAAEENEEGDKKRKGFVLSERKIEAGRGTSETCMLGPASLMRPSDRAYPCLYPRILPSVALL
jgi:hypothetical protein